MKRNRIPLYETPLDFQTPDFRALLAAARSITGNLLVSSNAHYIALRDELLHDSFLQIVTGAKAYRARQISNGVRLESERFNSHGKINGWLLFLSAPEIVRPESASLDGLSPHFGQAELDTAHRVLGINLQTIFGAVESRLQFEIPGRDQPRSID
ncbi:MAG TPA: hypothetical protein VLF91_01380 [Candidatus Saccharimonadales bacterium]|nr:hypothetical protein [Candidatus Saccharimonadales bacterium]